MLGRIGRSFGLSRLQYESAARYRDPIISRGDYHRVSWYQAIHQELTVGIVIAFVAYLANLYRPLSQLANVYVEVGGEMAVFERQLT